MEYVLHVMASISAVLLFLMMILTFADVLARYIVHKPIFGAAEMIQFLLALTIFSGLAVINAEDDHVTVELFDVMVRDAFPILSKVLVQGVSILIMGLMVWQMARIAVHTYELGTTTIVLEWPMWIASGATACFAAISFVVQIIGLFAGRQLPRHDVDHVS
ncbi:TRAP transporter small permease [Martelella soudanensis]|nr:TRAP transporter small permease [Martelella sp. NC18]